MWTKGKEGSAAVSSMRRAPAAEGDRTRAIRSEEGSAMEVQLKGKGKDRSSDI
jgi:hypothetical protein